MSSRWSRAVRGRGWKGSPPLPGHAQFRKPPAFQSTPYIKKPRLGTTVFKLPKGAKLYTQKEVRAEKRDDIKSAFKMVSSNLWVLLKISEAMKRNDKHSIFCPDLTLFLPGIDDNSMSDFYMECLPLLEGTMLNIWKGAQSNGIRILPVLKHLPRPRVAYYLKKGMGIKDSDFHNKGIILRSEGYPSGLVDHDRNLWLVMCDEPDYLQISKQGFRVVPWYRDIKGNYSKLSQLKESPTWKMVNSRWSAVHSLMGVTTKEKSTTVRRLSRLSDIIVFQS